MTAIEIKKLPVKEKIDYFKKIFNNLNTDNEVDILNIYRMVNSYNTFDDNFFEDEKSYINDVSEFIDVKMGLIDEINDFSFTVIKYFLAIIKSCDINECDAQENAVEIPSLVFGFLANSTVPVIATMMNATDLEDLNINELPKVKGGFYIFSKLFQAHTFVTSFLDDLLNKKD